LNARNKTETKEIQKKKCSEFIEIDIVTMTMVDPMHTVFLGMIRHEFFESLKEYFAAE